MSSLHVPPAPADDVDAPYAYTRACLDPQTRAARGRGHRPHGNGPAVLE